VRDLDEFIEEIAGRSWVLKEPYRVRLADGTETDAISYLRSLAREPAPAPEPDSAPAAKYEPRRTVPL
jgi:hypothetical protein